MPSRIEEYAIIADTQAAALVGDGNDTLVLETEFETGDIDKIGPDGILCLTVIDLGG